MTPSATNLPVLTSVLSAAKPIGGGDLEHLGHKVQDSWPCCIPASQPRSDQLPHQSAAPPAQTDDHRPRSAQARL